jgi:hypothetical protein
MNDLRTEVAIRLRETLDGKEVDMLEDDILIEHMLGIAPLGDPVSESDTDNTLLDKNATFWQRWHDTIHTEYDIRKKISSTIKSLMEDGILNISYPYGKDAEIAFIEVNWPSDSSVSIHTTCNNCESIVDASLSLGPVKNSYNMVVEVACENCGKDSVYESHMTRR